MVTPDSAEWFEAIAERNYRRVRELLPICKGVRNAIQDTGLMVAVRLNDPEMVEILSLQEAGLVNKADETALLIGAQLDHVEACRLLVPLEKMIYYKDGRNALMIAAECGSLKMCQLLAPEFPMERDPSGYTAFDYCIMFDHMDCLRILVEHCNTRQEDLMQALDLAEQSGKQDFLSYLQLAYRSFQQKLAAEAQATAQPVRVSVSPTRSGSTPMNATLNRNEIRARSAQPLNVTGLRKRNPAANVNNAPNYSVNANNVIRSPPARHGAPPRSSFQGVNAIVSSVSQNAVLAHHKAANAANAIAESTSQGMNMSCSVSGITASSSVIPHAPSSAGQSLAVSRAPQESIPQLGAPPTAAETQALSKHPDFISLLDKFKSASNLRDASLLNALQKHVAALYVDLEHATRDKRLLEQKYADTLGQVHELSELMAKKPSTRGLSQRAASPATEVPMVAAPAAKAEVEEKPPLSPPPKPGVSQAFIENMTEDVEISGLVQENAKLLAKVAAFEGDRQTYEERIRSLSHALTEARADIAKMSSISSPAAKYAAAQEQRRLREEERERHENPRQGTSPLAQSCSRSGERMLRDEVDRLNDKLDVMHAEMMSAREAKSELENALESITQQALTYQDELTAARTEKINLEERILTLEERLLEAAEGAEGAAQKGTPDDLIDLQQRILELEQTNQDLTAECQRYRDESVEMQSQLDLKTEELAGYARRFDEVQQQALDQATVITELRSRSDEYVGGAVELEQVRNELALKETELEGLGSENENLMRQVSELQDKVNILEKTVALLEATGKGLTESQIAVTSKMAEKSGTGLRPETKSLFPEYAGRARSGKKDTSALASLKAANKKMRASSNGLSGSGRVDNFKYSPDVGSLTSTQNAGTSIREYNITEKTNRPGPNTRFLSLSLTAPHLSAQTILSKHSNMDMSCVPTGGGRKTELMDAAEEGDVVRAWKYIGYQAGLQDADGRSALMYAAQKGCTELVRALIAREARLTTALGTTALMDAACNGNADVVELLVEMEGGMATRGDQNGEGAGLTALMLAAHEGHMDCVHLLLHKESGMVNAEGLSARDYAKTIEIRNLLDSCASS